jgi:elongation factor Ts
MSITLEQIKSLRERTGVSTMACKQTLEETGGDEEKAIELLRKKGEAKAAKRADRSTNNGVVAIAEGEGKSAILALACETDFVAKNEDFVKAAKGLAQKVLENGEDIELTEEVSELTLALGEKIDLKDKKLVEGNHLGTYVHGNNKIGVIVKLSGETEDEKERDVAMHVAAMNPKNISPEDIADEIVEKEKVIWTDQLKEQGKPEEIIGKIMMGKEKKFREEAALLTQSFVKNPELLIKDFLEDVTVEDFWRFET